MNIEESKINLKNLIYQYKRTIQLYGDFFIGLQEIQAIETLLTAYEKEKEKNKSLEQENSFLKMMYRGTDEFKAIEKFVKEE